MNRQLPVIMCTSVPNVRFRFVWQITKKPTDFSQFIFLQAHDKHEPLGPPVAAPAAHRSSLNHGRCDVYPVRFEIPSVRSE